MRIDLELIDTHCHLTFEELERDIDAVITRSRAVGVTGWVTIGTDIVQIEKVLSLLGRFENMRAGIGFHPHYANEITDEHLGKLNEFAGEEKIAAIGETGLDYHYDNAVPENQKRIFTAQLEIAGRLGLPVIVHIRDAFDDAMGILEGFGGRLKDVVVHCFSGTKEQAEVILSRGYHISFTGIVTFKRCDDVREAARLVPLDRLMIETDCPFISPEPVRNKKPCEPAFLVHIAKKLAEVHGMEVGEFAEAVTATSRKFFGF